MLPLLPSRAPANLLHSELVRDLRLSISTGAATGGVSADALTFSRQYQRAVRESIASFEGRLDELVRFLTKGPYEGPGPIPVDLFSERIGDDETGRVINFIHCRVVSAFQGALAELLALGPVATLVAELKDQGSLPLDARLYVGDAVMPVHPKGGTRKGADMHVLAGPESAATRTLVAVVEVKSFSRPFARLRRQLRQHVTRASDCGVVLAKSGQVSTISRSGARPVCIAVVPGTWRLRREFRFEKRGDTRRLVTAASPTPAAPVVTRVGPREWHIVLGWSHEALAEAAYALTFWLMGEVGAKAFAGGAPSPWPEMSPEEAGHNAVKMMLYCAMLRCPTSIAEQRAIALYNTYGFGYALGMNFRKNGGRGRREMLWPEDLDEMLASSVTKQGCGLA